MKTSPFFRFLMVNTRAGGAPADAEGITRAEDEEEGLNDDADGSTLYNLFKEDLQFIKPTRPTRFTTPEGEGFYAAVWRCCFSLANDIRFFMRQCQCGGAAFPA